MSKSLLACSILVRTALTVALGMSVAFAQQAAPNAAAASPGTGSAAAAPQSPGPGGPGRGGAGQAGGGAAAFFGVFNPEQTFQQRCITCHNAQGMTIGDRTAPSTTALKALSTDRVYEAIATGLMTAQANGIVDRDKRALAMFVTGKPFSSTVNLGVGAMTNACRANPPLGDINATPSWLGWSATATNAHFQPAAKAKLQAADAAKLQLQWAFGIPGGGIMSGQPTVAFGRVFVSSDNNMVYSLDAKTGCVYWAYDAGTSGRFAPTIGKISGHPGVAYALYFATGADIAYAVDAHDGKELWKTPIPNKVTDASGATRELNHNSASVAYHDGRVYVPFAGTETFYTPAMECCRSRGALAALDANTGKLIWRVETIPEPAKRIGTTKTGVPIWSQAGASIWNTPTIDAKRKRVYVGTGNGYGPTAADTTDSVIAYDMKDGSVVWSHQEFKGDTFMASFGPGGCGPTNPPGGACPEKMGPDWDFGGSSAILQTLPNGKDVILAAGKGGVAIALDPDNQGKVLWRTTLYDGTPPTALGLVLWGGSSDGQRVYYAMQQPGGGLKALDINTGKIEWSAEIHADQRGQSGAVSAIPGVVFTGGWDGILRAVESNTGKVVWTFNTATEFKTINGVSGKGGSLGVTSATIVDGTVYVGSGYVGVRQGTPGNVLLAFRAK